MNQAMWSVGTRPIYVSVEEFQNKIKIHIRHYFQDDLGIWHPTKKGVALDVEEWKTIKSHLQDIDNEIQRQEQQTFFKNVSGTTAVSSNPTPESVRSVFGGNNS